MAIDLIISNINEWVLGWPLMLYVMAAGLVCTIALKGIQVRYFIHAWKTTLLSDKSSQSLVGDMTPLQAFINTLSSNLGNGSIGGMAAAIYIGGPGSAFWVVVIGFLLMSIRFAEVYTSTLFGAESRSQKTLGGPMLYLKKVIAGDTLAWVYAVFTFFFGLVMGNAVQANSIGLSLTTTWGISPWINASVILGFVAYVVFGGAARIVKVSDTIVPIKVVVFFSSTLLVLGYHYASLLPALKLICSSAFTPLSFAGGVVGYTIQQAISAGIFYSIMATESGLGSAAILFGFTGSKDPIKSGMMGMVSACVSTLVCFIVAMCIVASGVWHSGLTSTALTIAAFDTVFGQFGGWIVSFLSVSFGIGVIVTYAYITRAALLFLTNGKYPHVFTLSYCLFAFGGALMKVDIMWELATLTNAGMLAINLFGLMYLLPIIRPGVVAFMKNNE